MQLGWGELMANTPILPCGYRFCAAITRVVIACPDLTIRRAAEIAQCPKMSLYYRAERMGIKLAVRHVEKRIPAAKIREVWAKTDISLTDAAKAVGLSERTLWKRAMALKLKPKPFGPARAPVHPQFASLWRNGVGTRQIAALTGVAHSTVTITAKRMGLPPREKSHRPITVDEWAQIELAEKMRATAAAEQREMILAEMADFQAHRGQVGRVMGQAA